MMTESSTRPYLIRAIHEWCSDNGYRPFIAVSVDARTVVPREFVRDGEIVLNVSTGATNRLRLGNDLIEFEARFSGVVRQVSVPVECVSAIYAAENGHGMAFDVAVQGDPERDGEDVAGDGAGSAPGDGPASPAADGPRAMPARARLSSVPSPAAPRSGDDGVDRNATAGSDDPARVSAPDGDPSDTPPTDPTPSPGGRPRLTRIK